MNTSNGCNDVAIYTCNGSIGVSPIHVMIILILSCIQIDSDSFDIGTDYMIMDTGTDYIRLPGGNFIGVGVNTGNDSIVVSMETFGDTIEADMGVYNDSIVVAKVRASTDLSIYTYTDSIWRGVHVYC